MFFSVSNGSWGCLGVGNALARWLTAHGGLSKQSTHCSIVLFGAGESEQDCFCSGVVLSLWLGLCQAHSLGRNHTSSSQPNWSWRWGGAGKEGEGSFSICSVGDKHPYCLRARVVQKWLIRSHTCVIAGVLGKVKRLLSIAILKAVPYFASVVECLCSTGSSEELPPGITVLCSGLYQVHCPPFVNTAHSSWVNKAMCVWGSGRPGFDLWTLHLLAGLAGAWPMKQNLHGEPIPEGQIRGPSPWERATPYLKRSIFSLGRLPVLVIHKHTS
jgi:hypothetical protein